MDDIEREFADHIDDANRNQAALDDADIMNELFGDEAEEAEEAPERQIKMVNVVTDNDVTKVKRPKRILIKLDCQKLFSDRGLSAIPSHIKPLKFKGKGHELEDITNICRAYEHWAHRLYPKMTFRDVLEQVEHLGMKNRKKCILHKSKIYDDERRLNEITGANSDDEEDVAWPEPQGDSMFGETTMQPNDSFDSIVGDPAPAPVVAPSQPIPSLNEEQLERMRQNRLKALQKKKDRESGVGSRPQEMSPLARTDVQQQQPSNTEQQSSESDCQAPSKRFKPDTTNSPSLSLSLNTEESNQTNCNNSMSVESESNGNSHRMSVEEKAIDLSQPMSVSSPAKNLEIQMSVSENSDQIMSVSSENTEKMTLSQSHGEPMIGDVDADIANEINDLID